MGLTPEEYERLSVGGEYEGKAFDWWFEHLGEDKDKNKKRSRREDEKWL